MHSPIKMVVKNPNRFLLFTPFIFLFVCRFLGPANHRSTTYSRADFDSPKRVIDKIN